MCVAVAVGESARLVGEKLAWACARSGPSSRPVPGGRAPRGLSPRSVPAGPQPFVRFPAQRGPSPASLPCRASLLSARCLLVRGGEGADGVSLSPSSVRPGPWSEGRPSSATCSSRGEGWLLLHPPMCPGETGSLTFSRSLLSAGGRGGRAGLPAFPAACLPSPPGLRLRRFPCGSARTPGWAGASRGERPCRGWASVSVAGGQRLLAAPRGAVFPGSCRCSPVSPAGPLGFALPVSVTPALRDLRSP